MAQDLATAGLGVMNAAYFADYWWRRNGGRGRRIGAAALVLVSLASVVEALFSQALFWSQRGLIDALSPGEWALVRLPLFVATLLVSLIIFRKVVS